LNCNHSIGLHLRLKDTLADLVDEALNYRLSTFQFFLIKQKTEKYITLSSKEKDAFLKQRHSFGPLFVHSSYWINPASNNKAVFNLSKMLLKKELAMAQTLQIEYLVLHAGSAKGHLPTQEDVLAKKSGLAVLAKMLNSILKKDCSVTILLENSAHGKRTLGNDLMDFVELKALLDKPEKIGFCLDTAHAFSYGYDVTPVDNFIKTVDKAMGTENIKLIHFNDSQDKQGCKQDRHALPGQGNIGKSTLSEILHHPKFKNIPKIIEAPAGSKQISLELLQEINAW
jgi:deoxyribonuclease-4